MARGGRSGANPGGTHFQGPLLARQGPLEDLPLGLVDQGRSPYRVYYEDFRERFVDNQAELSGWQSDDLGSGTANSAVRVGADEALLLNAGSTADEGIQIQFKLPAVGTALTSTHRVLPEFTSTTTLMDNREIFFQTRFGIQTVTAATNDSKWAIGIFADDDELIAPLTGLPAVAAGGGFGFFQGEDGVVTAASTEAAITAAGTALDPAVDLTALTTDATTEWHTCAARVRVIDADAGTGRADFWWDGRHRLALTTVPFDSTELYSMAFAICNGPATVNLADMFVDYVITGITRPGLTWPYTDGTIY